ncbi:MAG: hypothetical protein MUC83_16770 [Pirellula sp.]|nr:hypothetical protein [Pirellula sp.]
MLVSINRLFPHYIKARRSMTPVEDEVQQMSKSKHGILWWLLLPLRIPIEILVTLFDLTLSRHLIAAIVVSIIWTPLHFAIDLSFEYWLWPTVILGVCLTGLWEGCDIFIVRPYLSRWLLIPYDDK